MNRKEIKYIIESIMFAYGEPIGIKELNAVINEDLSPKEIEFMVNSLIEEYKENNRGIQIIKLENKYQMCTNKDYADYIKKVLEPKKRKSLSQATLETLTIIAYKQPITISIIVATIAILIETLAPIQTLVNKSLPIPSLPNQNSEFGDKFFFDVTTVS